MTQKTKTIVSLVVEAAQDYIRRCIEPFSERLKAIEARTPERGERGEKGEAGAPGEDAYAVAQRIGFVGTQKEWIESLRGEQGLCGKDADLAEIDLKIIEQVAKAAAEIPRPADGKDGRDGADGKDADPAVIAELVSKAVEALPKAVDGRDGEPGKDADPALIVELVSKAIEALPKPADGKNGADGKDADPALIAELVSKAVEAVPKPADGRDGKDADPALIADLVSKAIEATPKPADGRDGRDGEPGRDALMLDVLDGIDPAKRYQRGTFAAYRGGIVRSFKSTEPLPEDGELEKAGWHVVVRGIAESAVEVGSDLRTFGVAMKFTDGSVVTKTIKTPAVLDQGVFKAEETYQRGDGVTWGGSFWIAQKDAPIGKPGDPEADGWRLAVKRGRDGRDGLKGEAGERGAEGRAGRDLTQRGLDGSKW